MKNRNKRNLIIGILGILLVFVGIGYALLSTNLTINSTSNVAGTWDVEIKEIVVYSTTGNAISNNIEINDDKLGARVNNTFESVGDSITYDVTVENKGNIDANISCVLPTDTYFTYTKDLLDNTLIKSSKSFKFQIKITYSSGEPQESVEKEILILARQDDGTGIEVSKGKTLNPNIDITSINFSYNLEDYSATGYTDGSYFYNGTIKYNKAGTQEKIYVYIGFTSSGYGTNLYVNHYNGETLIDSYILSNDGEALYVPCYSVYVDVSNKWAKLSGDDIECDYVNTNNYYKEVTTLPVFSGNWVLDENSIDDNNRGTYYLNALIDVE